MYNMGKNKMIAKSCPKCELQVAVASKTCKCGHTFFSSRRGTETLNVPTEDMRRRTGRVRRSQPQFYDSQHYQKQKKRSPKKRSLSSTIDRNFKKEKGESATARARRRRALRRAARSPMGGDRAREPTPQLRPPQIARLNLILQEINRKMKAVTWRPPTDP